MTSPRRRHRMLILSMIPALWLVVQGGCSSGAPSPPGGEPRSKAKCGDTICSYGETCASCPDDCGACASPCGDGRCDAVESCKQCPADCGACPPECGDGDCNGGESCSTCADDCGACPKCGDGTCNGAEKCYSCPGDCGACPPECGDGKCNGSESWDDCKADCAAPAMEMWSDTSSACDGKSLIGDGVGIAWTWVRVDTSEVVWDDGSLVTTLKGTFVDTSVAPAKLYVNGTYRGGIDCGLSDQNNCFLFWRDVASNQFMHVTVDKAANTYSIDDAGAWVACNKP